ncbi:class I adenylate-forming enzyme family protein [Actinoplanes sp. N902-109]|uniref:class I adenylate-forming enzyme family protein n=1 Tax=Actinoplanes sp. (strain N902-109) TaxID=649831 RepID=UPI0003294D58|nr:class I adenylate-forming enzyme family protein [Actinoplanes sp. N902-109]AGL16382.1 peptide synthetase [Actinoplanes sp. N902-109]
MTSTPHWWGAGLLENEDPAAVFARIEGAVTFGELARRVGEHARRFASAGIGAGRSVALCLPPSFTLIEVLLALWSEGATVVLVDSRHTASELARLLELSRPQTLVTAPAAAIGSASTDECRVDMVELPDGRPATGKHCLIQFSSGSTGTPKMIGRSSRSLLAELAKYAALPGMPGVGEKVLVLNSPVHTMGLVGGILHGLNVGAESVLPTGHGLGTLLRGPQAVGIQAILGVPMHFDVISRTSAVQLPALRLAVSAGELMRDELWSRFHERFAIPISPVYGTTETGILTADLVTACPPPSVGKVLPENRVKVENDEVQVYVGESPYLGPGADDRVRDGWLRTFDRGAFTADGRLALYGRSDSLAVIGGLKVDLREVEALVSRHPGVADAVVVHDSSIKAYVRSQADRVAVADLIAWCREHLSGFKIPSTFIICDTLPRTVSGKVVRDPDALRQHAEAHRFAGEAVR